MTKPTAQSADAAAFEQVRQIFAGARFLDHLGIRLDGAGEGWCETSLEPRDFHFQQHGHIHAGVLATLADHTAGGAARSRVGAERDVITVEFKINFFRPARATQKLRCRATVLRAGKRIAVAEAEVFSGEELVAKCTETLAVLSRSERRGSPVAFNRRSGWPPRSPWSTARACRLPRSG